VDNVESLRRGLQILEVLGDLQPVGVTELAKRIDLPKSTVQRLLMTLAQAGWIEKSKGDLTRWQLARQRLVAPKAASAEVQLRETARPYVVELCTATNETVHLVAADGINSLVLIDRADCDQAVRTWRPLGTITPMHSTSTGLAVLANCTPAEIDEVIGRGLEEYTRDTITDPVQLRAELARIRQFGYSVNLGGNRAHVYSVGAAIFGRVRVPIAAICITMPDFRYDESRLSAWGEIVRDTADHITADMAEAAE
jgi:IclR family transcriptional regulator, acetate operon repressor